MRVYENKLRDPDRFPYKKDPNKVFRISEPPNGQKLMSGIRSRSPPSDATFKESEALFDPLSLKLCDVASQLPQTLLGP